MTINEKEINRKLLIFNDVNQSGNIAKPRRYFGIPRSFFMSGAKLTVNTVMKAFSGRNLYPELTLIKHLMKSSKRFYISGENYHIRPTRIMCYMARNDSMRVSDVTIYRSIETAQR